MTIVGFVPSDGDPVDPLTVDALILAGVRDQTSPLRTSSRLMMTTAHAQAVFDAVVAGVEAAEHELGRELPAARSQLAGVAADQWTGVTLNLRGYDE